MKLAKVGLLLLALVAMALSIAPAAAQTDYQDLGGSGGSGGGAWRVTCTYDGQEHLLSKSCSSGGNSSCSCP